MQADRRIAVIGIGNMGSALAAGILKAGGMKPQQLLATDVDEQRLLYAQKQWDIRTLSDNAQAASEADVLLLAVKPQVMHMNNYVGMFQFCQVAGIPLSPGLVFGSDIFLREFF